MTAFKSVSEYTMYICSIACKLAYSMKEPTVDEIEHFVVGSFGEYATTRDESAMNVAYLSWDLKAREIVSVESGEIAASDPQVFDFYLRRALFDCCRRAIQTEIDTKAFLEEFGIEDDPLLF